MFFYCNSIVPKLLHTFHEQAQGHYIGVGRVQCIHDEHKDNQYANQGESANRIVVKLVVQIII